MDVSMKSWFTWMALCITVLVMSASAEGENMKKPEKLVVEALSYYVSFEIMNRVYNTSLMDPDSPDYKKMYSEVSKVFDFVYGCSSCPNNAAYQGVIAMSFRKGSVIADSTIVFKGSGTNVILLKFIFMNALYSNTEINGFQINPESVQDSYATSTPPTTATTTVTTTTPITTTTATTTTTTTTATTTTPTTTTTATTTTPTTTTTATTTTTTTPPTPTTTTSTTPRPKMTTTTNSTTPPTSTKPTTITKTSTTPTTTATTPKTTAATSEQSSRPPILHPTNHPKPSVLTTTTKSSSSTIRSHSVSSSTIYTRVTNSSSNNNKDNKTEPVLTTSNPSSNQGEGVPGWAIALLVLAAIAILLLIIIIIILLVRWCCVDNGDDIRSLPPQEHTPYMRTTFREPVSVPAYSPHTPQKTLYPFGDLPQSPKNKPNRTGTYVVNPER